MGACVGGDRVGQQPLLHYSLDILRRYLFEEEVVVCLYPVGWEAPRPSERERIAAKEPYSRRARPAGDRTQRELGSDWRQGEAAKKRGAHRHNRLLRLSKLVKSEWSTRSSRGVGADPRD
ncbi:hypothetical protein MRX96_049397 [Rhipicephalus microplus]